MGKRNRERVARIRAGTEEPRCTPAEERLGAEALRDEVRKTVTSALPKSAKIALVLTMSKHYRGGG